ncbi:MAG: hypothetical protein ACKVP4_10235 [Hyphomicrobium sp.]
MKRLSAVTLSAVIAATALIASSLGAAAKISAMSGAYDGARSPTTAGTAADTTASQGQTAQPRPKKKRRRPRPAD